MVEIKVRASIGGSVWQIPVSVGDRVQEDDPIVILESMKMEIPIGAPRAGTVRAIAVETGQVLSEDDVVAILEPD